MLKQNQFKNLKNNLVINKNSCIFALAFATSFEVNAEERHTRQLLRVSYNEKNVSTFKEKEKKQARFQRKNGFC